MNETYYYFRFSVFERLSYFVQNQKIKLQVVHFLVFHKKILFAQHLELQLQRLKYWNVAVFSGAKLLLYAAGALGSSSCN
jgi:hypothetical protein